MQNCYFGKADDEIFTTHEQKNYEIILIRAGKSSCYDFAVFSNIEDILKCENGLCMMQIF